MIIRILLTVGIVGCFLYFHLSSVSALLIRAPVFIVSLIGAYLIWNPDDANAIALAAGVGRGADLLLYTWVIISLFVVASFHIRHRATMQMITQVVRKLALISVEQQPLSEPAVKVADDAIRSDAGITPHGQGGGAGKRRGTAESEG
jgi:hypothetical protein